MESRDALIERILASKPEEGVKVKYQNMTLIFKRQSDNKIILQQKLKLSDLGINDPEDAIITEFYFYNNNKLPIEKIPPELFWVRGIKICVDENNKIHVSKYLNGSNTDLDRGYLNYLIKVSNKKYIGVITHEEKEEVKLIEMIDIIKKCIFSN